MKLAKQFLSYSVSYGISPYSKNRNLLFIICWNSLNFSKQSDFYCPSPPSDFCISKKKIGLCDLRLYVFLYKHTLLNVATSTTNKQFRKLGCFLSCSNSVWIQKNINYKQNTKKIMGITRHHHKLKLQRRIPTQRHICILQSNWCTSPTDSYTVISKKLSLLV